MISMLEARRLLEDGRIDEAERAYQSVLEAAPDNVEALNVVALGALRDGRVARALELLKHAAAAHAKDAVTQHHLARAHEAAGDFAAAAGAYRAAVRLEPAFFVARLHLADCLERLRRNDEAFIQYKRAVDDAQGQGRWLNPATTPAPLRAARGTRGLERENAADARCSNGCSHRCARATAVTRSRASSAACAST